MRQFVTITCLFRNSIIYILGRANAWRGFIRYGVLGGDIDLPFLRVRLSAIVDELRHAETRVWGHVRATASMLSGCTTTPGGGIAFRGTAELNRQGTKLILTGNIVGR